MIWSNFLIIAILIPATLVAGQEDDADVITTHLPDLKSVTNATQELVNSTHETITSPVPATNLTSAKMGNGLRHPPLSFWENLDKQTDGLWLKLIVISAFVVVVALILMMMGTMGQKDRFSEKGFLPIPDDEDDEEVSLFDAGKHKLLQKNSYPIIKTRD